MQALYTGRALDVDGPGATDLRPLAQGLHIFFRPKDLSNEAARRHLNCSLGGERCAPRHRHAPVGFLRAAAWLLRKKKGSPKHGSGMVGPGSARAAESGRS